MGTVMRDTRLSAKRHTSTAVKRLLSGIAGCIVIATLFVRPDTAYANSIVTGEDLQKICDDDARFTDCVSYLETIYKTAKAMGRVNVPPLKGLAGSCGPELGIDTVPLSIARRLAWQEYAGKHPERLKGLAVEEVLLAYEARWPCRD